MSEGVFEYLNGFVNEGVFQYLNNLWGHSLTDRVFETEDDAVADYVREARARS